MDDVFSFQCFVVLSEGFFFVIGNIAYMGIIHATSPVNV